MLGEIFASLGSEARMHRTWAKPVIFPALTFTVLRMCGHVYSRVLWNILYHLDLVMDQ